MVGVTVAQIKAARSLLNWSQEDLSGKCGISITALANIERGHSSPRVSTMNSIKIALEKVGVEFIGVSGVILKEAKIKVNVLSGSNAIIKLWQDIYDDLEPGEERLISGVDENKFYQLLQKGFAKNLSLFKKKGIKGKIICTNYNKDIVDISSEYRILDKDQVSDIAYYVYGNKYALLLWKPNLKIIIIDNAEIAKSAAQEFYENWNIAKPISSLRD